MGKMKGKNTSGTNAAKNGGGHCWTITVYKYILSVFHWCWSFSEEWITMLSKWCHANQHISTMPGHICDLYTLQKSLLWSLLLWNDLTWFATVTLHLRMQYTLIAAFPQSPANMYESLGFLLFKVSVFSSCYFYFVLFSFICLCLFKLLFSSSIFLFICPNSLYAWI